MVARRMLAPPARAPIAPKTARKASDAADTTGTNALPGDTTTISNGIAAPTENIAADERGLDWAGCGDFRDSKFVACVGRQCIIRHQLLSHLPRQRLVDTSLDVDFGKFIEFKPWILAQFLAFPCKIGLLGIRLRTYGNIFASRHRHCSGHQSRNTCDQDVVSRCSRRGNADNQTRGRNDAVICPENGGSQPSNPIDEMAFGVRAKATHVLFLMILKPLSGSHCLEIPRSC